MKAILSIGVLFLFSIICNSTALGQPVMVETLELDTTLTAWGGMTLGPDGNLYLTDFAQNDVNAIDGLFSGGWVIKGKGVTRIVLSIDDTGKLTGKVEPFITDIEGAFDLDFDRQGNLVVGGFDTDEGDRWYFRFAPDGSFLQRQPASGLPIGITRGPDNLVYATQCFPSRINTFSDSFLQGFLVGTMHCPTDLAFDEQGQIYAIMNAPWMHRHGPDGSEETQIAHESDVLLPGPGYLTYANGSLYATKYGFPYEPDGPVEPTNPSNQIFHITTNGTVTILAGREEAGWVDGPAHQARFFKPGGIAASVTGDTLFVVQVAGVNSAVPLEPTVIRMITGVQNAQTSGVASEVAEQPETFMLEQNYPNPFNPGTHIRFTLAQTRPVTLTVYDLYGREVATLFDGIKPAGAHEVQFDAGNLSSGTYIYQLKTDTAVSSRHMTIIK